jgi:replicative DNA helicase
MQSLEQQQSVYSPEGESAVLGCLITYGSEAAELLSNLREDWFFLNTNKLLFQTIEYCLNNGVPVDHVSLDGLLKGRVSMAYITGLMEDHADIRTAGVYADTVHDYYRGRMFNKVLLESSKKGSIEDKIDYTMSALVAMLEDDQRGIVPIKKTAKEYLDKLQRRMDEGVTDLVDAGISWVKFRRKGLTVLGGSPGTGKTTLAMRIMQHVSKTMPVYYRSIEMGEEETMMRSMSNLGRVDLDKFDTANFEGEDWNGITNGAIQLIKLNDNLIIDYSSSATVSDIRTKANQIKLTKGDLGLIVIDYFQEMDDGGDDTLKTLAKGINQLKKDLNCHVLVLAQLNKDVYKHNKRPNKGDIDFGKQLTQDADLICYLYQSEGMEEQKLVNFYSAKTRSQKAFNTYFEDELQYSRLSNTMREYQEPEQNNSRIQYKQK